MLFPNASGRSLRARSRQAIMYHGDAAQAADSRGRWSARKALCQITIDEAGVSAPRAVDDTLLTSCFAYGALAVTLLSGYVFTVLLSVFAELPSDGRRAWHGSDVATDVMHVLSSTIVLGWLVHVDRPTRCRWMSSNARLAAASLLLFFATSPVFSAFNEVPGLQISLSDGADGHTRPWSSGAIAGVAVAAVAALAVFLRHLGLAWHSLSRPSFTAYVLRQAAIVITYAMAYVAAQVSHNAGKDLRAPHLHHLYVGLVIASFAYFDTVDSVIVLAIGAGVMIQGIGAYGWAPLASVSGCKRVMLPAGVAKALALQSSCRWSDAITPGMGALHLDVCPADASSQAQSLFMRCGSRPA